MTREQIKDILKLITYTIVLIFLLFNLDFTINIIKAIFRLILPFIIGIAIAFILNVLLVKIEKRYKKIFYTKLKTITFDTEPEFRNRERLEKSCRRKERKILVYYAHLYRSGERGHNENNYRLNKTIYTERNRYNANYRRIYTKRLKIG